MFGKIPVNSVIDASKQLERNRKLSDFSSLQKLFYSNKPLRWLFAGDSITHGCLHTKEYPRFSEIFEFYLSENPPRRGDLVLNTGVSGATSAECLDYEKEWLFLTKADAAFICFGMNDAVRDNVSADIFRNNLLHFIRALREREILPILQTPQLSKRKKYTDPYNDIIRETADREKVLLVDLDEYWKGHKREVKGMMSDSVHPDRYGHLQWARLMIKALGFPERSKVFTVKQSDLKGHDDPFLHTGSKIFADPSVKELLKEDRVTWWLLIGDFKTGTSFPKRTAAQHFEEILRFKLANDGSRTSMMRFCVSIDTSLITCEKILEKYDFYIGSKDWDAIIFYPCGDAGKSVLKEKLEKDFPFIIDFESADLK